MTLLKKISKIESAKADIASAIEYKGGTVPKKLSLYGAAIRDIPQSVTTIIQEYFAIASAVSTGSMVVKGVTFPPNVTYLPSLGDGGMSLGRNVEYVNFGNVETVRMAFSGNARLSWISGPKVKEVGDMCFMSCGLGSVSLPVCERITGNSAFADCRSLSQLDLPVCERITGNSAFADCHSLSQLDLPVCQSVGPDTFKRCASLSVLSMPKLTSTGTSAFAECSSLSSVNLPELGQVQPYVFSYCHGLHTLTLPKASVFWGSAFAYCGLMRASFPSCDTIYPWGLGKCEQLSYIDLTGVSRLPTLMGDYAFDGNASKCFVHLPASVYSQLNDTNRSDYTYWKKVENTVYLRFV